MDKNKDFNVPARCPKCKSKKISIYFIDGEKGFKCLKCPYKWAQIKKRNL